MESKVVIARIALLLFGTGWIAGGIAQDIQPEFVLMVTAPAGETTIRCIKGCSRLEFTRTDYAPDPKPQKFEFGCRGSNVTRCSSGKVAGYLNR
jgi:hypothetical protein